MGRTGATAILALAAALWAAASVPAGAQRAGVQTAVDLELVLAADGSGSIDDAELALQREGYAAALTHPDVLASIAAGALGRIAVAFVEWGGATSQHTIVDWRVIDGPAAAESFAAALRERPRAAQGWNSISGAIDHAARLIAEPGIEGTRKVIDVSGDGPHYGGRPVEQARDEAVAAGITINALVVAAPEGGGYPGPGGMALSDHYALSVIGGFGAFVLVADRGESFRRAILAKLIREIADARPTGAPQAAGR
ncbi:MAG: DUF1194 domain-containing protein [Tistlia sp.]|uniref:DUF1194 domain-containing protein n=1 Tax=Tistlia sp. TaxID=3057121 RepID=UPI0034A2856C